MAEAPLPDTVAVLVSRASDTVVTGRECAGGRRADLLADLVVTLALEALDQLDAALQHDAAVHQDVHELGLT